VLSLFWYLTTQKHNSVIVMLLSGGGRERPGRWLFPGMGLSCANHVDNSVMVAMCSKRAIHTYVYW